MGYLSELDAWMVAMGHVPNVHRRESASTSLVRPYRPLVARPEVLNSLICTRIESGTARYGHTELNLRVAHTWVWAMGPVAHARDVGPRSDHYHTTRGGVTPRLGRIDSKIQSSSAREAVTICTLINVLLWRVSYMHGGYGSCTKRA